MVFKSMAEFAFKNCVKWFLDWVRPEFLMISEMNLNVFLPCCTTMYLRQYYQHEKLYVQNNYVWWPVLKIFYTLQY